MGLSSYCILNIPYSYNIGEEEFVLMTAAAAAFSFLVVFATTAITTIATAASATSTTAVVLLLPLRLPRDSRRHDHGILSPCQREGG